MMYYRLLQMMACCVGMLCWNIAAAQTAMPETIKNYQQFSTENGLSQNVVYALHQDEKGFLWVATDHGLNRYDGYHFTKYYRNLRDTTSIPHNSIYAMVPGKFGKLWLATGSGLCLFDLNTAKARNYFIDDNKAIGFLDAKWFSATELLLFANTTELYLFDTTNKRFSKIQWIKKSNVSVGFKFWQLPEKEQFAMGLNGKSNATYLSVSRSAVVEAKKQLIKSTSITKSLAYAFETNTGLTVLLYFDGSIEVYNTNKQTKQFSTILYINASASFGVFGHCVSKQHTYIATSLGLLQVNNNTGVVSSIKLEQGDITEKHKQIRASLIDKENNLWIGTFGNGLLKVKLTHPVFKNIPLEQIAQQNSESIIFSIKEWSDRSVVLNHPDETFTRLISPSVLKHESKKTYATSTLLKNDHNINYDNLSLIQQKTIAALREVNPTFTNRLLVQGDSAILEWGACGIVFRQNNNAKSLFAGFVYALCVDQQYYWWGTTMGLLRMKKDLSATYLYQSNSQTNSLSENLIGHMVMDEKNNLWIGTKGGGLNYFDRTTNTFYQYSTAQGLPDNVVYHILPDQKGNLWLNTNNGLCKFNIATKTCRNFSKRDGLINDEFNRDGGLIATDGVMYFSGTSGIDYLPVNAALPKDSTNAIQIVKVEVNGNEKSIEALSALSYKQNNIALTVTTNNFNNPEQIYFRYRLNNNRWDKIRGSNKINFYALPAGEYTIEVQAGFDNDTWSSSLKLSFTIKAPWWQTSLFYELVLAALIFVLWLLYHYRIKQLKKTIALRTQLAKDLHDDVGASLSSIHIYSSVVEKLLDQNPEKAKSVLQQINSNTRHAVENMNDIIWAMNTNFQEHALEKKLKNFGYDMLTPLNIHCTYHIESAAEAKLSAVHVRKQILLICKEAMNNIAKYSHATHATIVLKVVQQQLFLQIADNGKGFDLDSVINGNGLINIKDRATLLGGTAHIVSKPNEGTTVACYFPLTKISEYK